MRERFERKMAELALKRLTELAELLVTQLSMQGVDVSLELALPVAKAVLVDYQNKPIRPVSWSLTNPVLVDFNAQTEKGHIRLSTVGSVKSLAGRTLMLGDWVCLRDEEQSVMARICEYEGEYVAAPNWGTRQKLLTEDDIAALEQFDEWCRTEG